MDQVRVKKAQLIETLRANRDEHAEQYQRAIEKYRERTLEWFNAQVEILKAGRDPQRSSPLPVPEEHTEDFDRVIEMMNWTLNDEVELSQMEFEQYVRNQWGWARTFTANTAAYLVN